MALSPEQKADIIESYKRGEKILSIATRNNCDSATVHNYAKRAGIWKRKVRQIKLCAFPECSKNAQARGYCHTHYCQLKKKGQLTKIKRSSAPPLRRLVRDICDHSTNACDCLNPGQRDYVTYLAKAGIELKNEE